MTRTNEPLITGSALETALAALPGWTAADGWLHRTYRTDGWRTTMLAVNAIAFVAEAGNHHPDLGVHWGRVEVHLQTHSAGGITQKDLELAERIHAALTWLPTGGFPGLEGHGAPLVSD
ncbi:MAG TPA: 4a-hydroxytetrahydrobiopterin dehydratase [Gemmatimonadales bacterium]|nr:4a-hydroxytetrahydrobiopterin dehydratase [Gemmatimonadales bacterium]